MEQIFARIHTQLDRLKAANPDLAETLELDIVFNDGATDSDFEKLEAILGYSLPDEFKAIYRIHNGEKESANIFLIEGEEWLSIDRIIDEYKVWHELYTGGDFSEEGKDIGCDPDTGIKPDYWWNPKWISLTADGGGNGKMIDLDPSANGTMGQIIQMWHDDPARSLEALSLQAYFEKFATDLEQGKYEIHPEYGITFKES